MVVNKGLFSDLQKKNQKKNTRDINQSTLQKKDINVQVGMLRPPLDFHMQRNTKVALNSKRAQMKRIGRVKNAEGMKVVQTNILGVTSVRDVSTNVAQHLKVKSHILNVTNV